MEEETQFGHTASKAQTRDDGISEKDTYLEMYLHLFRACSRSIEAIRDGRPWDAEHDLIRAQQETEAMYIEA